MELSSLSQQANDLMYHTGACDLFRIRQGGGRLGRGATKMLSHIVCHLPITNLPEHPFELSKYDTLMVYCNIMPPWRVIPCLIIVKN